MTTATTPTKPWYDRPVSELTIPSSVKAHVVKHTHGDRPVKTWADVWAAIQDCHDIGLGIFQERVREQIQTAIDEHDRAKEAAEADEVTARCVHGTPAGEPCLLCEDEPETKEASAETKAPEPTIPDPQPEQERPMSETSAASQTTEPKRGRGRPKKSEAKAETNGAPAPSTNGAHAAPTLKSQFEIAVAFRGVSIGDKTCRIGFVVGRNVLSIDQADERLCDRRLTGRLVAKPGNAQANQPALPNMEDADLSLIGAFDVKGFRVTSDEISAGLTFQKKGTDVETLSQLANREGRLVIERVEEIPESEDEDSAAAEGGSDADSDEASDDSEQADEN